MNVLSRIYHFFFNIFCRIYQWVFYTALWIFDWTPPKTIEGPNSLLKVPSEIKAQGLKKPLIVTDKCLTKLHMCDGLIEKLKEEGLEYAYFDDVQPNPIIKNIEDCRNVYLENHCDSFITVGGGSAMDCAKVAACRIVRPKTPVTWLGGILRVLVKLPPFFAVPTTAGTGSETTCAAVVVNPENQKKFSLLDPALRPKYAILDPCLTVSLPKHITSTTGMDALTHAVEAYTNLHNVPQTTEDAELAVKLIFANLEKAYRDGQDINARMKMLQASFHAGLAFTRASVGYVHAIAHTLGGIYDVPHGFANAVILPHVLEYFGKSAHASLAKLAVVAGLVTGEENKSDEEKAKIFIDAIKEMNSRMNIPTQFDFIKEKDIDLIVKRTLREGNPLYPVPKIMNSDECRNLIYELSSNLQL
ncbi:alcohol dehydrogenase class IV [Tritrichomonas foetus]|uniref:Alcohol dehydrogenase 4 n=1 Tax=Tritrichomonas foetus TaxID=1144522 RepID=A0A1J4K1J6_9EUKA|nr:alcohol dehydrogenase class IV [Tritrichomonas foetus]|eukprot:OHT03612.1 alcohol dehydrogenase class IV [Tritrichomonas foetus]